MNTSEEKGNRLVAVDLAELSRGLKTTFTGVAMVFGSLGCKEACEGFAAMMAGAAPDPMVSTEKQIVGQDAVNPDDTDEVPVTPVPDGTAPVKDEAPAEEVPTATLPHDDSHSDSHDTAPEKPTAPTVSADDITKVIVAKIKQKRSNNAKIGSLLKTYGVGKVSDLPPEKYEAFLTDISQL